MDNDKDFYFGYTQEVDDRTHTECTLTLEDLLEMEKSFSPDLCQPNQTASVAQPREASIEPGKRNQNRNSDFNAEASVQTPTKIFTNKRTSTSPLVLADRNLGVLKPQTTQDGGCASPFRSENCQLNPDNNPYGLQKEKHDDDSGNGKSDFHPEVSVLTPTKIFTTSTTSMSPHILAVHDPGVRKPLHAVHGNSVSPFISENRQPNQLESFVQPEQHPNNSYELRQNNTPIKRKTDSYPEAIIQIPTRIYNTNSPSSSIVDRNLIVQTPQNTECRNRISLSGYENNQLNQMKPNFESQRENNPSELQGRNQVNDSSKKKPDFFIEHASIRTPTKILTIKKTSTSPRILEFHNPGVQNPQNTELDNFTSPFGTKNFHQYQVDSAFQIQKTNDYCELRQDNNTWEKKQDFYHEASIRTPPNIFHNKRKSSSPRKLVSHNLGNQLPQNMGYGNSFSRPHYNHELESNPSELSNTENLQTYPACHNPINNVYEDKQKKVGASRQLNYEFQNAGAPSQENYDFYQEKPQFLYEQIPPQGNVLNLRNPYPNPFPQQRMNTFGYMANNSQMNYPRFENRHVSHPNMMNIDNNKNVRNHSEDPNILPANSDHTNNERYASDKIIANEEIVFLGYSKPPTNLVSETEIKNVSSDTSSSIPFLKKYMQKTEKQLADSILLQRSPESIVHQKNEAKNTDKSLQQKKSEKSIHEKKSKKSIQEKKSKKSMQEKNSEKSMQEKNSEKSMQEKKSENSKQEKNSKNLQNRNLDKDSDLTIQKKSLDLTVQNRSLDLSVQKKFLDLTVKRKPLDQTVQKESFDRTVQKDSLDQTVQKESLDRTVQKESLDRTVQKECLDRTVQKKSLDPTVQKTFHKTAQKNPLDQTAQKNPLDQTAQKKPFDQTVKKPPSDQTVKKPPSDQTIQKPSSDQTVHDSGENLQLKNTSESAQQDIELENARVNIQQQDVETVKQEDSSRVFTGKGYDSLEDFIKALYNNTLYKTR